MNKKVKYRLEENFLSRDYEDSALETSSPIYSLEEGLRKYEEAIKEFCVDDKSVPVRCILWKYRYKKDGTPNHVIIKANYEGATI